MPASAPLDAPWALPAEAVAQHLGTHPREGLSPSEAAQRLARHGPNQLRAARRRSAWRILVDQFASAVVALLVAAGAVAVAFGDYVDAAAIAVVLLLNAAIGFVTELRATRSMEALQHLGGEEALVVRGGRKQLVAAADLVPGDVVLLEAGTVVAADVRLLATSKLQVDEAVLTGESVPVDKQADPVPAETTLAERTGMAYQSTAVTRGTGRGVVVATGMATELGGISALVEAAGQEAPPLEKRLARLGRRLAWVTLAVAAAVVAIGLAAGRPLSLMISTGVALAVAAIPEGLPIVSTVALARGLWRLLRRNALVRRLSSVETLGATGVICTDKTGTLTENRMTVRRLALPSGSYTLDDDTRWEAGDLPPDLHRALVVAVLCNDAERDGEESLGDPLEAALLALGERAGLHPADLAARFPEVNRDAFDRETKMMATVHEADDGFLVAVKGAPEQVLTACTSLFGGAALGAAQRRHWEACNDELASEGLRVLALATKTAPRPDAPPYEGLAWLGLLGLLDPPRADVPEAIARCRSAGIRVVMVTGDQPPTALYIARAVGLAGNGEAAVLHGNEFDAAGDERLRAQHLFARVTPAQKLRLIEAHQAGGAVVAMTGDGVNDAPALKRADIGIAMGARGTQVAREAADMVLRDDAFSTIVAAVEQGRIIFDNIRKFVVYLLSGNVGEILAVALAVAVGAPLPLLPLQILYLNLINDVFPALALGIGGGNGQEMARAPRPAGEPLLARRHWGAVVGYGAVIGATILGAFFTSLSVLGLPTAEAVTVAFLTLSLSRLLHVFNMRGAGTRLWRNEVVRNPAVWGALALCVALLALALYLQPLAAVLQVAALPGEGWAVVLGFSLVPLGAGQLFRAARPGAAQKGASPAAGGAGGAPGEGP